MRMVVVAVALLLTAVLAVGCTPSYAQVGYDVQVQSPPPTPYVEYVGPPPGPGYTWIAGYWWWSGSRYIWVRGHWAIPPRPGYVWVRSGWVHSSGHYYFVRGRWITPGRRVHVHYVHSPPPVRVYRRRNSSFYEAARRSAHEKRSFHERRGRSDRSSGAVREPASPRPRIEQRQGPVRPRPRPRRSPNKDDDSPPRPRGHRR